MIMVNVSAVFRKFSRNALQNWSYNTTYRYSVSNVLYVCDNKISYEQDTGN